MDEIARTVKEFILEEFLPGEDPDELTEETQLFSTGVLDSLASLKLVEFLEEQFGIDVEAHDVVADNLDTLLSIANFVQSKAAA